MIPYLEKGVSMVNCWEFMVCGREKGGANEYINGICPAYPDSGGNCYSIAGTYCDGEVQCTCARELRNCVRCSFFQKIHSQKLMTICTEKVRSRKIAEDSTL